MRYFLRIVIGMLLLPLVLPSLGQPSPGLHINHEHYRQAEAYLRANISKKVYHLELRPEWLADSTGFWHLAHTRQGKRFFLTRFNEKESREAFCHDSLARQLTRQLETEFDAADLPFDRIEVLSGDSFAFRLSDTRWHYHPASGVLRHGSEPALKGRGRHVSPDGRYEAFLRDYNLFVKDLESGREIALSDDGTAMRDYGNPYGWYDVMEEPEGRRPERISVSWSPDSRRILAVITDISQAEKMYLLDHSIDSLYRPRLLSYFRGSPGDTTLVYHIPVIFDVKSGRRIMPDISPIPHFMGMDFRWNPQGDELYGPYTHRGYKQLDMLRICAESGRVRTLFSEHSELSVESGKLIHERIGDSLLLFSSERDGWYHLYLYDWDSGEMIRQLTRGDFVVKSLVHIDKLTQRIYFMASGREPGRNPYQEHLYSVALSGQELMLLSPEDAHHQLHLSPCKTYVIDNYSRPDLPTVSVLRQRSSGEIIQRLSEADTGDLYAMGWRAPMPFVVKGRDNVTDIYGLLYHPAGFSPDARYALINYAYSGPHGSIVPKSFSQALINIMAPLTQFGFAVMVVDGLGTGDRSRDFRAWSYRNIGGNIHCHAAAVQQLVRQHPWLDIQRVGIFGHSAGGYDATRAMLLYPDLFKVGVSSAADHDHRMEKAWWPEMYMGYPVGEYYHEQSNITQAARLEGRLLIAHGGIDENVNPSASFKLAENLIAAGRDFDMLILPGLRHSFGRDTGDYFTRVRWNYFIRHLLEAEPIHNYQFQSPGL